MNITKTLKSKIAFLALLLAGTTTVSAAIDADIKAMPAHRLMRMAHDLRHAAPVGAPHHAALGVDLEAYALAKHAALVTHAASAAAVKQADYDPYYTILKDKAKVAIRALIMLAQPGADAPLLDGAQAGAGVVVGANPASLNRNAVLAYIDQEIDAIDVAASVGAGTVLPANESVEEMMRFTTGLKLDAVNLLTPILEAIRTAGPGNGALLVAGTAAASGGRFAGDNRDDFVAAVIAAM